MPHVTEGVVHGPKVLPQGGMGVKVEGRPHLLGNACHRDFLAIKFVFSVREMVHGVLSLPLRELDVV